MIISGIPNDMLRALSNVANAGKTTQLTKVLVEFRPKSTQFTVINGEQMAMGYIEKNLLVGDKRIKQAFFQFWGKPPINGTATVNSKLKSCIFRNTNAKTKMLHTIFCDSRSNSFKNHQIMVSEHRQAQFYVATNGNPSNGFKSFDISNLRYLSTIFGNHKLSMSKRKTCDTEVFACYSHFGETEMSLFKIKRLGED